MRAGGAVARLRYALAWRIGQVTGSSLGPYQTAVVRIGFAATWLAFLLRELPHRAELYGPGSPWGWDLARRLVEDNGAFTVLMWSDSSLWFELVYGFAILVSVLLLLGWRTRTMSVLFMAGVLSLQNRSVFMGDGGDNVIHLMAMYLVLTRCGQVWSLDARRRRRGARDLAGPWLWSGFGALLLFASFGGRLPGGWAPVLWGLWLAQGVWWLLGRASGGERARGPSSQWAQLRLLGDVLGHLLHNAGLLIIMAEACLIYATAGWYKIQGGRWQDGTAVHYPLRLEYFSPWPALSDALASHGTLVMLITYGTVGVQVAFPFALFNRRVKNVLLAGMMGEHLAIAVLLGLPFFSLAMIAADAVFLPTGFLRGAGRLAARGSGRARKVLYGSRAPGDASAGGSVPAQRSGDAGAGTADAEETADADGAVVADGSGAGADSGSGTDTGSSGAPVGSRP